jgi:glucose/arabinose dehydrogenase
MHLLARLRCRLACVVAVAVAVTALPVSNDAAHASTAIGAGLHGPTGLHAVVFAKGLRHASAFAVDGDGRVWVATAAARDAGHDAIYVVDHAGATPTKVVTDVHTPLGLQWVGDVLCVSEAQRVLARRDFDGHAFASRTPVVSFPAGTGEVNGITLGTDGRLYVGISAACDACESSDAYSASIVSFLPDGRDLQVYARDIRAPIGLAFLPGSHDLFVTMNQRDDLGKRTPGDWLAVVRGGESWGFPPYYGQTGARWSAMPRPVAELDEHAAVSGIALVTGQLGASVGTAAVVAEWTTGKVKLVRLTATDDGYTGRSVTFLRGFANPVPVGVDRSGALLVGDWTRGILYRVTVSA